MFISPEGAALICIMAQSYGPIFLHLVFATKRREQVLTPELHIELSRYVTPILHERHARLVAEGGMPDHVHLLVDLGRESAVATLMREIKSKSSAWLTRRLGKRFAWQGGYGVFSVSPGHLQNVVNYIEHQPEHHRQKTFQEEYVEMLRAAGVKYDPSYLWNDETGE